MSKQDEALEILKSFGLPRAQQNERSALTLLALAKLGPKGSWRKAQKPLFRIWDIMGFMREKYEKDYAANSRETIRRQTIHQFEQARIVDRNPDDPSRPTNSGNNCYCLTDAAIAVLKTTERLLSKIPLKSSFKNLANLKRLTTNGAICRRSNSNCQRELRFDFHRENTMPYRPRRLKRWGHGSHPAAKLLYLGDTAKKHVVCAADELAKLKIGITEHDKLPDIVLFDAAKNWLFLIEAVTTHGPVNPKRHAEIEAMLAECPAERVYVTAFLDKADFRKYAADIAWETEVWIAETPDHMIHFNGLKFLGPYN